MKEINFEVYTKNSKTGEDGWDINFVSVIAESKAEAKLILSKWDLFDCIILFNYSVDLPEPKNGSDMYQVTDKMKVCKGWILDTIEHGRQVEAHKVLATIEL